MPAKTGESTKEPNVSISNGGVDDEKDTLFGQASPGDMQTETVSVLSALQSHS